MEVIQCNPDGGEVPGASSPPAQGTTPLLAEELREVQGSCEGHIPGTFSCPSWWGIPKLSIPVPQLGTGQRVPFPCEESCCPEHDPKPW